MGAVALALAVAPPARAANPLVIAAVVNLFAAPEKSAAVVNAVVTFAAMTFAVAQEKAAVVVNAAVTFAAMTFAVAPEKPAAPMRGDYCCPDGETCCDGACCGEDCVCCRNAYGDGICCLYDQICQEALCVDGPCRRIEKDYDSSWCLCDPFDDMCTGGGSQGNYYYCFGDCAQCYICLGNLVLTYHWAKYPNCNDVVGEPDCSGDSECEITGWRFSEWEEYERECECSPDPSCA